MLQKFFSRCLFPVLAVLFCLTASLALGEELTPAQIAKIRQKAEQGDADSQFEIGYRYLHGEGVNKNEKIAFEWLLKAAQQGNDNAQFGVGICLSSGQGVQKNDDLAEGWYRMAAENGNADFQFCLAEFYVNKKIPAEAYKWFLIAAARGHEEGERRLPLIEFELTLEQRAEGQRLAAEWQAAFEKRQPAK